MSHGIKPLGFFSGPGGEVPIFGADSLDFSNKTDWSNASMPVNMTSNQWKGDETPSFDFNFTIFAGVDPLPDRSAVHKAMKAMLSWAQHQGGEGTNASPPPRVECRIPGYISSGGSMMNITASAKGPWEPGGTPYPTSCTFSGTFLIMPFYDGKRVNITSDNGVFTSDRIAGSMFSL